MRIVVCGSRTWRDADAIRTRLMDLPSDAEIIVGGAAGADWLAERVARDLGFTVRVMPAEWRDKHGAYNPRAGFERNTRMLDENPDLVIAFWDGTSRGTENTLKGAEARGIKVEIHLPPRADA